MEMEDEVRGYVRTKVRAGLFADDYIISLVTEVLGDGYGPDTVAQAAGRILLEEKRALAFDSLSWPPVTDCDRLDAAFAALESRGIVARQNFSCCGNCGSGEIWTEINAARESGRVIRGYTFFHEQDTDSAADGHSLYLNYGAAAAGESAAVAIANEIVAVLNENELATVWDGSLSKRIFVRVLWQRRQNPPQLPT